MSGCQSGAVFLCMPVRVVFCRMLKPFTGRSIRIVRSRGSATLGVYILCTACRWLLAAPRFDKLAIRPATHSHGNGRSGSVVAGRREVGLAYRGPMRIDCCRSSQQSYAVAAPPPRWVASAWRGRGLKVRTCRGKRAKQ